MKIKTKYIGSDGMEYASKRSKSSKVKVFYTTPIVKKDILVESPTEFLFENDNVKITYSKGFLRCFDKVVTFSKASSQGKGSERFLLPVESLSFSAFTEIAAAL